MRAKALHSCMILMLIWTGSVFAEVKVGPLFDLGHDDSTLDEYGWITDYMNRKIIVAVTVYQPSNLVSKELLLSLLKTEIARQVDEAIQLETITDYLGIVGPDTNPTITKPNNAEDLRNHRVMTVRLDLRKYNGTLPFFYGMLSLRMGIPGKPYLIVESFAGTESDLDLRIKTSLMSIVCSYAIDCDRIKSLKVGRDKETSPLPGS